MSKRLLLFRHGKTHKTGYGRDLDRELTPQGEVQARHIGKHIKKENLVPDRILSSSAARAKASAEICAEGAGCASNIEVVERLYGIHTPELVGLAAALDDKYESVMLVGHNPAFEEAASVLAGRSVALGTGDCALLTFAVSSWAELGEGVLSEQFELIRLD